jgi:hypothetical protein
MAFSAFEQFEIIRIIPLHIIGNLDISITNSTIFMLLALAFFYYLFKVSGVSEGNIVPTR